MFPAATALVLLYLLQGLLFLNANSQTSDEGVHLVAGYSYLARGDFRLNPEHPPLVKELAALPVALWYRLPFEPDPELWGLAEGWFTGMSFLYGSQVPADRILFLSRLPNLLLGTVLVALIGWWAARLWGRGAGLLALALAALDPNLVTHGSLVTTDMAAALFPFLALYLAWEHGASPQWRTLIGVAVACGLALASKYSTILLVGILAVVIGGWIFLGGRFPPSRRLARTVGTALGPRLGAGLVAWLLILLLAAPVILGAYFFMDLTSWWSGLRTVLAHQSLGHPAFFLGEHSMEGWWSYFLVTILIKTPVGSLLLIAASLALFRTGQPFGRREVIFLLLPAALFFAAATWGKINIGLRHVLPIYPFLYVAASRLATIQVRPTMKAALLGIPLVWTAISSLSVAPHQLAYFNELVGGPARGHLYLSDSNIDWGQDLRGLGVFLERRGNPAIYLAYFGNAPPAAYGIRYQFAPSFGHLIPPPMDVMPEDTRPELLAVSVYNLQGIGFQDRDLYGWLRARQPVATIGYSIRVYDISDDVEAHLRLAEGYLQEGPWPLAVPELQRVLAARPTHRRARRLLDLIAAIPPERRPPAYDPLPVDLRRDPERTPSY